MSPRDAAAALVRDGLAVVDAVGQLVVLAEEGNMDNEDLELLST